MTAPQLVFVYSVVAFPIGAMPFAAWLTRTIAHRDVRKTGDGNPGAGNAFRAGGWRVGVPSLILEVGKAGIPVGAARLTLGVSGWALVLVALAPILGHAFSPFLRFKGGKAIAATFGSWAGLTGYVGPLALAVSMGVLYALQTVDSYTVLGGMLLFGLLLLLTGAPLALLAFWLLNAALLTYTQRAELTLTLSPRGWLRLLNRWAG